MATMWENTNFRARGRGRGRGRFFRGRGIAFSRGRGWCGGSAPIAEVPPNNTISDDRPLKITVQTEKETARDDHNARRDSKHSESRDFAKGRSKSRSRSPISKRPLSDRLGHQDDQSSEGEESIRITVGNEMFSDKGRRSPSSHGDGSGRRGSPYRDRRDPSPRNRRGSPTRDRRGSPPRHRSSYRSRDSPSRDRRSSPSRDKRNRHGSSPSRYRRSSSPRRDRHGSPPRRDRHNSPHRDRRGSSPYRDRRGSPSHRDRRGSSPSRYRRGPSPLRDRRGLSPSRRHRDSPPRDRRSSSPYSDRHTSPDRNSPYRSPPRQEMRFLTGDTDLRGRNKPPDHLERGQHLYSQKEALPGRINPGLNTGARSDIQSGECSGHSPIFKDLYRESSPSRAEPDPLQPLRRHPLPGFSYVEDDRGSQSPPPNLSTPSAFQSQEPNVVTRMPLGLPGEQRAIPPPPTAKPKKSILKKSTDNVKQSPVISGIGDGLEALAGFTSAPEIIPQTKPLFPSAFPDHKPSQSQANAMPSVLPQSQFSTFRMNSMEIDDEEMFLYGKSSSSSLPGQGFDQRKDYLSGRDTIAGQKSVFGSSSLQDSLKFLRNEQSKPSAHPENPIVFDAKATAQLHSLASSVLLSQNSSRVNKLPDMLGLGNVQGSSASHGVIRDSIGNASFVDSSLSISSVAGLPSQEHNHAQSYQSGIPTPVSQPKEETSDSNLIQNPMIKGILQSIGFDFEMSKRMQERAKQATGLKVQQVVEPVKAEPLPSVEEPQFGINQTASFLSGGFSDIELRGSLFKKEEEDVESLVKSAQKNVRQAERNYRDKETKAMQFQNQEAVVDPKQSPYSQLQRHQHSASTHPTEHYTNTPPDPRQSFLKNMYDPLHDESVMYERDYDMPPQHLQHPDDRESHLIPLVGRDGSRISVDRDSSHYSQDRDSKRLTGRDHYDLYSRSMSHDRRSHSDRSGSSRKRSLSPRRSVSPRRSISPRRSASSDRRSISQHRRSFSSDRRSISRGRSISSGGRSISPSSRSLSPLHRRGLSPDTLDRRSRSPSRHSRHKRSDSYSKRSLSPRSRQESRRYRDSRRLSDDKAQIKIMRTFPSREKSPERYSIDHRYGRSESDKDEEVQETRTVVASGPVIRRTVLAPKVEVAKAKTSPATDAVKKPLHPGKSMLTQKEREKLMQESADRQRRLEGLERELERLRKQQNELMRKKQRQKDGHKDPVLVENSKLQEEIAQQISSLRKAADENSKTLKTSSGSLNLKKEVIVKEIQKEEIEETRTITTKSIVEPPPAKPTENVVYEYIDPGNHWCCTCNHISSNIFEVFHHLQSKKHLQKSDPYDRPWMPEAVKNPSGAPPKKGKEVQVAMIKGVEFLRPTQAFYCTLCCVFSGDELCAEHHLKSEEHNSKYKKYTEDNLFYERGINLDKAAGISMMKEDDKKEEKKEERKADKRKPEGNVKELPVEELKKRQKLSYEDNEKKRKQDIEEEQLQRQSNDEKRDQNTKESLKKSEKPVDDLSGEGDTEEKMATSDSSGTAIKLNLKGGKEPTASSQTGKKGKVFSNFTWTKKESKPLITKGSDVFADEEEDDDANTPNASQVADTKEDVSSAEQGKGAKIAIKLTGKTQIKPHVKSAYPTWTTVANKPKPVKPAPKPQIVTVRKSSKSEEETKSAPLDQFLSIGEASSKKPLPVIKDSTVEKSQVTTEKHTSTKAKSSVELDLASIPTPKDPPPPSKSSASEKESLEEMKLLGIDPSSSNPLAVPKPPPPASKAKKKKGSKNKKSTEKDQGSVPGSKSVQDLFDIFYGQKSEADSGGTPAAPQTVSSDTATAQTTTATSSGQIDPAIPNHYPSGPPTFLQNPPETFYGPPPFSCGPPAYQGSVQYGSQMNMFPQGPGPCQYPPQNFQQGFPPGRGFYPGPRVPHGPYYYGPRPYGPRAMGPGPFGPGPMGPGPMGPMGPGPMPPRPFGPPGPPNHGAVTDQSAPTLSNSTESNTTVPSAVESTLPSSVSGTTATCATAPEALKNQEHQISKTDPSTEPQPPSTVESLVNVSNTNTSNTDSSSSGTDRPVSSVEAYPASEPMIVAESSVPPAGADIQTAVDEGNLSEKVSTAGALGNEEESPAPAASDTIATAISVTACIKSDETLDESSLGGPPIKPEPHAPVDNLPRQYLAPEQRSPPNYTGASMSNPENTAKLAKDLSVTNHGADDSLSNMTVTVEPMSREEKISSEAMASNETVILQDDMSTLASLITPVADMEQSSTQNQENRTEPMSGELGFFGQTHGAEILRQDRLDSAERYTAPPEFSAPDQMEIASNDFMPQTLTDMISMDASLESPEPLTFNPEVLADMEYFPGEGITGTNASLTESLLGLSSGVDFVNPNMTMNSCEMQTDDVTSNCSATSMNMGDFHVLDECEED